MRIARDALKMYRPLVCEFCGEETQSGTDLSLCSNCESVVGTDRATLKVADPHLLESLESISAAVRDRDFASASSVYDALISERGRAQLVYAKGVMLIEQSNYETSQISYTRGGVMEENSAHRRKSLLLISDAKKHIAKALHAMEGAAAEGADDPRVWYSMLLCELKMGNLRGALRCAGQIAGSTDKMLADYSNMILLQGAGDFRGAMAAAELILGQKTPPVNALYYAAFGKLKAGKPNEALAMLDASRGLINNRRVEALAAEIRGRSSTLK
jgi:hypothetical protein